MTAVVPPRTKSDQHVPAIWPAIWTIVQERRLKAGDQLPSIRELADRLKVKQSVVRDALLKAETRGLITVQPRTGVFLRMTMAVTEGGMESASDPEITDPFQSALLPDQRNPQHNLFHLLDARRLIEIELAGRAAQRRCLEDLLPVRRILEEMLQLPATATRSEYVDLDVRFHIEIARLSGNQTLFAVQRTLMELLRPHLNEVPHDWQRRSITDRSHVAIYEALVAGDADRVRVELRSHLSLAYDCLLRDLQQPLAVDLHPPDGHSAE